MTMRHFAIAAMAVLGTFSAHAIPVGREDLIKTMRMPVEKRLEVLGDKSPKTYEALVKMAFNKGEVLDNRWKAITTLGRLFPEKAKPDLQRALTANEWFMRNAAAVVLPYGGKTWAIHWSEKLLEDPALLVRTAAVKNIRQLGARSSESALWRNLNSKQNFHKGKSLWVRRHIVEALEEIAPRSSAGQFVSILEDTDPQVRRVASRALQKLTDQKYNTAEQWQAWWSKRKI